MEDAAPCGCQLPPSSWMARRSWAWDDAKIRIDRYMHDMYDGVDVPRQEDNRACYDDDDTMPRCAAHCPGSYSRAEIRSAKARCQSLCTMNTNPASRTASHSKKPRVLLQLQITKA